MRNFSFIREDVVEKVKLRDDLIRTEADRFKFDMVSTKKEINFSDVNVGEKETISFDLSFIGTGKDDLYITLKDQKLLDSKHIVIQPNFMSLSTKDKPKTVQITYSPSIKEKISTLIVVKCQKSNKILSIALSAKSIAKEIPIPPRPIKQPIKDIIPDFIKSPKLPTNISPIKDIIPDFIKSPKLPTDISSIKDSLIITKDVIKTAVIKDSLQNLSPISKDSLQSNIPKSISSAVTTNKNTVIKENVQSAVSTVSVTTKPQITTNVAVKPQITTTVPVTKTNVAVATTKSSIKTNVPVKGRVSR
jgi:hypothetical protein